MKSQRGYTLYELLIVLCVGALLSIALIGTVTLLAGNFWFTSAGLLTAIQADHPETSWILTVERNVIAPSAIVVKNKDGSRSLYLLSSNVFFNYKLTKILSVGPP